MNNLVVDDAYNAFKQIQISWQEGVLDTDFNGAYTGSPNNTEYFVVSMNGEERAIYQNNQGDGATYIHHEPSLNAGSNLILPLNLLIVMMKAVLLLQCLNRLMIVLK